MNRRPRRTAVAIVVSSLLAMALVQTSLVSAAPKDTKGGPLGHFKNIVVIYEENHSFDNLYGTWGSVNGEPVDGLSAGVGVNSQVAQDGTTYQCLKQLDLNLAALTATCGPETVTLGDGSTSTYSSAFTNAPFNIDTYIPATATTCPLNKPPFGPPNGVLNGQGAPGGCTRDMVHRFYQEQYQIDGGKQDHYVTGSDSAGTVMGYYDSTKLPIYQYLNANGAPNYVIADHFFQGAFGGSFLNHFYLIAAQAPLFPSGTHSILDANGFPNATYPLYRPALDAAVTDAQVTQACGLQTTISGFACGDYAVNTTQPSVQPLGGGARLPLIDDTTQAMNIGDELSDANVSWNWYSGGWDDAAGITTGLGWTGTASQCGPGTAPSTQTDINGKTGFPYCPPTSFQFHHQPFNYYLNYAPGHPGRAHLQDEEDFLAAAAAGTLPSVSFVKPVGNENEHPGYASEANGSDHLVDLIQAIETGPQAGNTLIVVTYDEFGGAYDHVSPPNLNNAPAGQADLFGPGTRVPALLIARSLNTSTVDHTVYDTTSILATIEHQFGLSPIGPNTRDGQVNDLGPAISAGRRGH